MLELDSSNYCLPRLFFVRNNLKLSKLPFHCIFPSPGGVVFAGSQPEASGSHSPRGRRSNCANRGVTTSDPKVKVVFKPIPKPVGKGSADHLSANEISGKGSDSGPGEHAYFPGSVGEIGTEAPCHDPGECLLN